MSKVLVTGCSGFVGSVLVEQMIAKGYEVVGMDNMSKGHSDSLLGVIRDKKFQFVEGDVVKKDHIKRAIDGCDSVVHLAGTVGAPISDRFPYMSEAVNVGGTKNLIECLDGRPIVFASTGSVYGALEEICTEDSPCNPQSWYGIHKKEAEDMVSELDNSISLRFATGFGVSPSMRVNLLVNDLCFRAVHEKYLNIFQGHARRTFIHVRDMGRAFTYALQNMDSMKHKVYNCGSNSMNCTKKQLAEMISQKTGCSLTFNETDEDPDKRDYAVSYDRLNNEGFDCYVSLEDGIDELIKASKIMRNPEKYI